MIGAKISWLDGRTSDRRVLVDKALLLKRVMVSFVEFLNAESIGFRVQVLSVSVGLVLLIPRVVVGLVRALLDLDLSVSMLEAHVNQELVSIHLF